MRTVRFVALAGVVAAAVIAPATARGQLAGKFVVTPYVGAYLPTNDVAKVGLAGSGMSVDAALKHEAAGAFGVNASYWLNDRLAVEGGVLYAGSHLKGSLLTNDNGALDAGTLTQHANVWLGSTKLMLQVLPPESIFNLRFGIGPAIINRSGTAYAADVNEKVTGLTNFGAAMSLCTRLALSPNLGVRLRVENYMYRAKIGYENSLTPSNNYSFDGRMQNDFVVSAGLQIFLNR
jgi:outer membrane protein W